MTDAVKRSFRYNTLGFWYKGNVHTHSKDSDGGKTFEELAWIYANAGYNFLFRTDHWVCSNALQEKDTYPVLWLDGVEIDGTDFTGGRYHVVCLGVHEDLPREEGFEVCLQKARQQGALLILAHPHWSGNSLEEALRWPFNGVEIYNHTCHWLNGKGDGLVHWGAMLKENPMALAFSVDDVHLRLENIAWNGGWIMVNAARCSREEILRAIHCGNYYSTCGPDFYNIEFDGQELRVKTSPIRFARLVGPGCLGRRVGTFNGPELTQFSMQVPKDWAYTYMEIEDTDGKRAWTNGLFIIG